MKHSQYWTRELAVATAWGAILVLAGTLCGCLLDRETVLNGRTMGTTYQVKIVSRPWQVPGDLGRMIDRQLSAINQSMSTYRPDSELNRFNAQQAVNRPLELSPHMRQVVATAAHIHKMTGGAWDGTVDPLVKLWGFGSQGRRDTLPEPETVQALLARIGFHRLRLDADGRLAKQHPEVTLDLASIAKGYGVDVVARLLRSQGLTDFLVEIGGEVIASGRRLDGGLWRVGINTPDDRASGNAVYRVVNLPAKALATSGDYRNFFTIDGVRYGHVIDPRTGYPVRNGVVSATVVADNCTLADGLATGLMVMGPASGLALVDRLDGIECLIVTRRADGTLSDHFSKGFRVYSPDSG
jgi:thiamine biosynthesis lipoprotein